MLKTYLLSTVSHRILGYRMLINMIDKCDIQQQERKAVRRKRVLHEKAAERQGVVVS